MGTSADFPSTNSLYTYNRYYRRYIPWKLTNRGELDKLLDYENTMAKMKNL